MTKLSLEKRTTKPRGLRRSGDTREKSRQTGGAALELMQAQSGAAVPPATSYAASAASQGQNSASSATNGSTTQSNSSSGSQAQAESEASSGAGQTGSAAAQNESAASFDDYYNRLLSVLKGYGINLTLPSLDELYAQLEAFLRPSIDAAISARQEAGEASKAELDADAYSRGMGGSSYLSSMKLRENDAIASDIAQLEVKYGSTLAEYIYDAATELSKLQQQLAQIKLSRAYSYSSSSSKSQQDLSAIEGAFLDGKFFAGDYSWLASDMQMNDYARYLNSLTQRERYLLFHSADTYWRNQRWQLQYNLLQSQYDKLVSAYDGSDANGNIGGAQWTQQPY